MKKKVAMMFLAGMLLLCGMTYAQGKYQTISVYMDKVKLVINGQASSGDLNAMIYNGTVYLPIRVIGEQMGGEVTWNPSDRSVNLDFVVSSGDTVIAYSDHAIYQYIATEKNQIMQAFISYIDKSDYESLLKVMDRLEQLEELADSIGDTQMKQMLDKMAFSIEVIRSALISRSGNDYRLAADLFASTEEELSAHIQNKLSVINRIAP